HWPVATLLQPLCDLSGSCCFTGTLQADQHDNCGWLGCEIEPYVCAAEHFNKFISNNLHDLLTGAQALHDFLAKSFRTDCIRELLHDFEVHVRFQQRHANLSKRFIEVLFTQLPLSPQILENAL